MQDLPTELISSLRSIKGFNEESFQAVHQSGAQIVSVRLNPGKKLPTSRAIRADDEQEWIFNAEPERVPWSSNGLYLPHRPSFTLDPLFHAGAYYVQEASSMFLEEALKQTVDLSQPLKVLDLCAAPGGKSTLIQSIISEDSLLLSNEVIKTRVHILSENMTKWGAANVFVTNNDPADFQQLDHYFDVIVADAPCSGSGLFRKDPRAISEWSKNNVELCGRRQRRILVDSMSSLKAGGILIYSTCSYSQQEDEEIADWLIKNYGMESLRLNIEDNWGIVETVSEKMNAYGYRFYPDKVKGEGFFISAFRKINEAGVNKGFSRKKGLKSKKMTGILTSKEEKILNPYISNPDGFFFFRQHEEVIAIPSQLEHDLPLIRSSLYIKKAGIKLGTVIRNELIPAHDLSVSCIINPSILRLEVDKETVLQYLRRAEIKIEAEIKGWVLITYQQLPIGWIKIISNRCNNYYPKEWRILNK